MTDNGVCSLLGLAKRAGKLAAGDEPVRELLRDGIVRAVFLASDAGASATRQAEFAAERAQAPLLRLPVTVAELGGALGRKACALCAVSDSGFAAKAAEKLAAVDPAAQEAARVLAASHARFQSRRGTKKHRQAEPSAGQAKPRQRNRKPCPPEQSRRTDRKGAASRKAPSAGRKPDSPGRRQSGAPEQSRTGRRTAGRSAPLGGSHRKPSK